MTAYYVRSTTGNNANNGLTWATAKATLSGVDALTVAGDVVYVSNNHNEVNNVASITWLWAGSAASPTKILCVDDTTGEPPTALATTAIVSNIGGTLSWFSSGVSNVSYCYGLNFVSSGSLSAYAVAAFEDCSFDSGSFIRACGTLFRNCGFKFNVVGQGFLPDVTSVSCGLTIRGGSILAGSAQITNLVLPPTTNGCGRIWIEDFDFSNLGSSVNLFNSSSKYAPDVRIISCKAPSGWSGSYTINAFARFELIDLDIGSGTKIPLIWYRYPVEVRHETTLVNRSAPFSWRCVTDAACARNTCGETPEFAVWNNKVGSSITATVQILCDTATNLTNDQVWIEVKYYGDSGSPLAGFVDDGTSHPLASGSDQDISPDAGWITTGMTNPKAHNLSVSFTPQMAGYVYAKVKFGVGSKTIYVDPKVRLT